MYYVTVGSDHSAQTSWDGLLSYARQCGLLLHSQMINAATVIYLDAGSEYRGQFESNCRTAGIQLSRSTAHAKDGLNQIAESINGRAQQHARVNMVNAQANFRLFGYNVLDYWPQAYCYSALQNRARVQAARGELNYDQLCRAVPAPFGAIGSVVLHSGDPIRKHDHKQLAPRGTLGVLIGVDGHKCRMLMSNGEVHSTYAVIFDPRHPWGHDPVPPGTSVPSRSRRPPPKATPAAANDGTMGNIFASPLLTDVPISGGASGTEIPAATSTTGSTASEGAAFAPINNATASGGASTSPSVSTADHDDADGAGAPQLSFTDSSGAEVAVDDRVEVEWANGMIFAGHVAEIDPADSTYRVSYDDGDSQWHSHAAESSTAPAVNRIADTAHGPKRVFAAVSVRRRHLQPHPSVVQLLDDNGDIRSELLLGHEDLPPLPPLPDYAPDSQPSAPSTIAEALASSDALFWIASIVQEYVGHVDPLDRPATWQFTTAPPSKWSLRSRWVFVIKFDGLRIVKFKARLCVTGHSLTRDVDYVESYCGAGYSSDNRTCEAAAVLCGWDCYEDDFSQAFVQFRMPASPDGRPVIMSPARGARIADPSGQFYNCELVMSLYGHPSSGFALASGVCDRLLNRNLVDGQRPCPLHMVQSDAQPVLYRATWPADHRYHNERFLLIVNTDNLRVFCSDGAIYDEYRAWLDSEFTITGTGRPLRESEPTSTLGKIATYTEGSVRLDMPGFQRKIVADAGLTDACPAPTPMVAGFRLTKDDCPGSDLEREAVRAKVTTMFPRQCDDWAATVSLYRSLVANLNWLAKECAPILSAPVAILSRVMHDPPVSAFRAVHRVYRYIVGKPNLGITYIRPRSYDFRNGDYPSWTTSSDATLGDDLTTGRPLGGAGGGFTDMALDFGSATQLDVFAVLH